MAIKIIIKSEISLIFLNYSNNITLTKDTNILPKIIQPIHPKAKVKT